MSTTNSNWPKVVDCDTHFWQPLALWEKYIDPEFRDEIARIRPTLDPVEIVPMASAAAAASVSGPGIKGKYFKGMSGVPGLRAARMKERGGDYPDARIEWMDGEGVYAHIVYPNILGFGGQRALLIDADQRLAATQIYNEALGDVQKDSGQRIFGMALLPWWDIDLAVKEVKRCVAMGLRGVNINSAPQIHGLPDLAEAYWDPLWEVCVEHDLPINFHIGSSDDAMNWFGSAGWPSMADGNRAVVGGVALTMDTIRVLLNFMMSGVLDRFPKAILRFGG